MQSILIQGDYYSQHKSELTMLLGWAFMLLNSF